MRGAVRFLMGGFAVLTGAMNFSASPVLMFDGWETNNWPRVLWSEPTNHVYTVQASTDLTNWFPAAILHGREFGTNPPALSYIDASANLSGTRFYRLQAEPMEFEDDWRNQVYFEEDPFRNEPITFGLPETRWIKFAITTNEPTRVYYQNSWKYPFHYHFASARLPGFKGLTPIQFDEVSLHTNSQRIVLGAVLFSPRTEDREVGIQFVGQDPYRPEQIAEWFNIVRSTIQPIHELDIRYMPTFEQAGVAATNAAYFSERGIQIGRLTDWDTGANAYSHGWAMGRLVYVPAGQIQQAYAAGVLKPDDILLTDGIPAEIPYVAGILTLAPSTPNSHVAILARSYFIPFVYLAEPELRELAQSLEGQYVAVTAFPGYPQVTIRLLDVSDVDPALRDEIIGSKLPEPLLITPKARLGAYTAPTENLVPSDIQYFGGKAANFGFLRRSIATNSPPAIAISFDLWDDFMSQTNASGVSLRDRIAARLNKYTYPPNVAALADELETIRDWIEDTTLFTSEQQEAIIAALLGRFDPETKIRFRSSTNVEDAENFTGAGLYDSYSGCLADDQDSDTTGPSICDPTENNERGVFRAIRKVYASFYNDNAVLERLRHQVDESKVGMAILVHYSAPDPTEMANGVATINYTRSGTNVTFAGKMVTQKGAVSVTNPDGSALPEVVTISRFGGTPHASVQQYSTLVPFGAKVLEFPVEYHSFANLFERVARAFQAYYTNRQSYTLDFEYKKLVPGVLDVKQVREIPSADPNEITTTYLLNEPGEWRLFQGEYGTVFANHRLKVRLQLTSDDLKLTTDAIQQSVLNEAVVQYQHDQQIHTLSGMPRNFPNASFSVGDTNVDGTPLIDSWTVITTNNLQKVSLVTTIRTTASPDQSPLLTLSDARIEYRATYSNAVPVLEFGGKTNSVMEESVWLAKAQATNEQSILQTRSASGEGGVSITTSFFWPQPPGGATAGYTAPLVDWQETRIMGLTTEPIVLRGYYSQTYRPEHHNFSENFLFEPALEPGISQGTLEELQQNDIQQVYLFWGGNDMQSAIYVAGESGVFHPLKSAR